jgi:hypothetical protein
MKYIDSEIFEFSNGLNVERGVFYFVKRAAIIFFVIISAVVITRWDSIYPTVYSEYKFAFDCENYIRNEIYPNHSANDIITVEEMIKQAHRFNGNCKSDFVYFGGVIGLYIFLFLSYVFTSRGVKFRFDKKRRVIYTVVNWNLLVCRVPSNIDEFKYVSEYSGKKTLPTITMVNVANGKERLQSLGLLSVSMDKQEAMIDQATKMYFCEANQSSDDQWLKDTIKRSNDLKHSILFNIFVKPFYFSLFKEASLDDPKLLAKIDAYLEKNPPNPAKDDLYKDFDFYNQK